MTILSPTDPWPQRVQRNHLGNWVNADVSFKELVGDWYNMFVREKGYEPTYLILGWKAKKQLKDDFESWHYFTLPEENGEQKYMGLIVLDMLKEGIILA